MVSFDPKMLEYAKLQKTQGVQPAFGSLTVGAARKTEGGYTPNYEQYNAEMNTSNGSGVYGSVSGTNDDGTFKTTDIALKYLGADKLVA